MTALQRDEWFERVIALAALTQAAAAVKQVARFGSIREVNAGRVVMDSVLNQNPDSVKAMYPNLSDLRLGLESLLQQIGATRDKDVEVTRYVVGILALERRLSRSDKALQELGQRITQMQRQKHDFQFSDDTIVASMGSTYSDLISPLGQPLKINGKQEFLQQPSNQHLIRALLLAGVRNAVLWRQLGGKRRHFIFNRQRMVRIAQQLLRELREHSEPLS
ncbi:high frequency lysogenization protein HflD [Pseudidiomarina andamanensis]|uniref:High frequency lysogenization protein HflD homolog n=1 Tax=Pseudidiomarina andamanensis TaxID=1940690 RepID=A0AA92ERQ6_9GAMM|nr:high frequency lysogenization protein HflD [Pseudidiomarina andamanensis]MDS0218294.1 high frequency lysogenization protein HflD [Pseudidiomarina andamanensis]QGT95179.1 lysogenization regulator HflD [Pseudidiomarina andamanensis]